jgi:hypothetical protein
VQDVMQKLDPMVSCSSCVAASDISVGQLTACPGSLSQFIEDLVRKQSHTRLGLSKGVLCARQDLHGVSIVVAESWIGKQRICN